jgi:hypothetical protein
LNRPGDDGIFSSDPTKQKNAMTELRGLLAAQDSVDEKAARTGMTVEERREHPSTGALDGRRLIAVRLVWHSTCAAAPGAVLHPGQVAPDASRNPLTGGLAGCIEAIGGSQPLGACSQRTGGVEK